MRAVTDGASIGKHKANGNCVNSEDLDYLRHKIKFTIDDAKIKGIRFIRKQKKGGRWELDENLGAVLEVPDEKNLANEYYLYDRFKDEEVKQVNVAHYKVANDLDASVPAKAKKARGGHERVVDDEDED